MVAAARSRAWLWKARVARVGLLLVVGQLLIASAFHLSILSSGTGRAPPIAVHVILDFDAVEASRLDDLGQVCDAQDLAVNFRNRSDAIARAVRNVFGPRSRPVPPEDCKSPRDRVQVDFAALSARIGSPLSSRLGVIVYLAQKSHNSYGRDSFAMLDQSLDLLYDNYNTEFRHDVLVFHSGDFNSTDESYLRRDGARPELHLVELEHGSRFWELPGIMRRKDAHSWKLPGYKEGYRHMCRWYSSKLFEFVHSLGYSYVMRMDEDSLLLSPVRYDMFQFLHDRGLQYAYRLDAIEGCCDLKFRQQFVSAFLDHVDPADLRDGFYNACCTHPTTGEYNNYGYYNNFFASKVSFWLEERVQRLFNFADWTGAIYSARENDLVMQSLSVQLFMPAAQVHKFTDWSYAHVSGEECKVGGVVRGTADLQSQPLDGIVEEYRRRGGVKYGPRHSAEAGADNATFQWSALYCDKGTRTAQIKSFHK